MSLTLSPSHSSQKDIKHIQPTMTSPGSGLDMVENPSSLITKRKIQEMVAQIDPSERLEPEVEDVRGDMLLFSSLRAYNNKRRRSALHFRVSMKLKIKLRLLGHLERLESTAVLTLFFYFCPCCHRNCKNKNRFFWSLRMSSSSPSHSLPVGWRPIVTRTHWRSRMCNFTLVCHIYCRAQRRENGDDPCRNKRALEVRTVGIKQTLLA